MNELAFITAAKHHRVLMENQRRLDLQHLRTVRLRETAFENAERKAQLIRQKIDQNARDLRDRRKDIELATQDKRLLTQQEQELATIAGDALFKKTRRAIESELYSVQDEREDLEARLLRDIESSNTENTKLNTLAQRAADVQKALIEREARISERRMSERNADIKAEIDLRLSIDRISESDYPQLDPQKSNLGDLLDVQA